MSYYDLEETRDRAFGGTSNSWRVSSESHNVGNLVRLSDLDAIDFEKRDWVPYSGWPFSKSELIPYYERAQEVFNIGPYRYDTEFWDRDKLELKFKDRKVRTKIFQFGRKDVFTDEYRYELKNAENIKVYLNTTALKLKINEYSNRINSITATTPTGKRIEVNSQHFILAMGGLENPRIMLLSNGRVKNGIGNQHDLVGRFFMEHPHLWSGVFYPSNASFFDKSDLYRIQFRDNTPIMGKLRLSQEVLKRGKIVKYGDFSSPFANGGLQAAVARHS
ncbi:MAG: hypothetical protein U5K69_18780 [Balneolaceae bacterium]|nr:hypothetical protein [Balneolaceae bacterium]